MIERASRIKDRHGLHARPSKRICQEALQYPDTTVSLIDPSNGKTVDAKSVLEIMLLALDHDALIIIRAEGPHEDEVSEAIIRVIRTFDVE